MPFEAGAGSRDSNTVARSVRGYLMTDPARQFICLCRGADDFLAHQYVQSAAGFLDSVHGVLVHLLPCFADPREAFFLRLHGNGSSDARHQFPFLHAWQDFVRTEAM